MAGLGWARDGGYAIPPGLSGLAGWLGWPALPSLYCRPLSSLINRGWAGRGLAGLGPGWGVCHTPWPGWLAWLACLAAWPAINYTRPHSFQTFPNANPFRYLQLLVHLDPAIPLKLLIYPDPAIPLTPPSHLVFISVPPVVPSWLIVVHQPWLGWASGLGWARDGQLPPALAGCLYCRRRR